MMNDVQAPSACYNEQCLFTFAKCKHSSMGLYDEQVTNEPDADFMDIMDFFLALLRYDHAPLSLCDQGMNELLHYLRHLQAFLYRSL